MDHAKYKTTQTSRGFTYNYYFSPAQPSKPVLFFCHGFPSLTTQWSKIALFFEREGYGIIVPDMLGYGKTTKPTDPAAYVGSLMSKDLVDILDAEGIKQVVAIGHDWGSKAISRLANYYPERVSAYAFFAVPFIGIIPPMEFSDLLNIFKAKYGTELYGYWPYFASEELDRDFRLNPETFVHLIFPYDSASWKTNLIPLGAVGPALRSGFRTPLPTYLSEAEKQEFIDNFLKNGLYAPGRWYEVQINQMSAKDDLNIPESQRVPPPSTPIFFGAASKDYVCTPEQGYERFAADDFKNHNITMKEFDGDHWIIISHADEINRELKKWLEETVVSKTGL